MIRIYKKLNFPKLASIGSRAVSPNMLGENLLKHQHVHICRHLTAFATENEGIGAIPILDNVKPFIDFLA